MSLLFKISLFAAMSFVLSCNSSKKVSNDNENTSIKTEEMDLKLIGEGYKIGTIKYQETGECSYLITVADSDQKLDPINLKEASYSKFRVHDQKIYIKYGLLRMRPRCNNAQPIQIQDIKKRED